MNNISKTLTVSDFNNFRDENLVPVIKENLNINLVNPNLKNELAAKTLGFKDYHTCMASAKATKTVAQDILESETISYAIWSDLRGNKSAFKDLYQLDIKNIHAGDETDLVDWYSNAQCKSNDEVLRAWISYSLSSDVIFLDFGVACYGASHDSEFSYYFHKGFETENDGRNLLDLVTSEYDSLTSDSALKVLLCDNHEMKAEFFSEVKRLSDVLFAAA